VKKRRNFEIQIGGKQHDEPTAKHHQLGGGADRLKFAPLPVTHVPQPRNYLLNSAITGL
jgi:hypothetical protein